ncbi:MAG: helix-turn-helix domain-containing protein [Bacteroidota bacterium]
MRPEIFSIKSVSHLHQWNGFESPTHPLISVIDVAQTEMREEHVGIRSSSDLYVIGLKDRSCGNQYGRNHYDFDEGVLFFYAPNQVQTTGKAYPKGKVKGWMIVFHPDLIRNTQLGKTIDTYNFFNYSVFEALHVSEAEQATLTDCMELIKREIAERVDKHSQIVISSTLELLLNLSQRYYERQFNTRSAQNSDYVSQFENHLKSYYEASLFKLEGMPSVEYFSNKMHLSSSYLSDLLKKETGLNAKEHINGFIIDKAKTRLLGSIDTVSEIAYELGFNYPHYFSRLFKSKTGKTPNEFRQMN